MKRELLACGLTGDGQLGMRPSNDLGTVKLPEHIIGGPSDPNGSSVVSVACGEKHTLFLANDGKVWSVGGNEYGQLGRGSVAPQGSFTIYPINLTGTRIIQIACGRVHCLAVAEDGRLFGWGSNVHGQLATPHHIKKYDTPKRIVQLSEVVQVACGPDHCICLCESGRVFVWGQKWDGANIHEPQEVVQLHGIPIVRIEAGGMHCIALSASGRVFTWGQNEYGQLGNMNTRPSTNPVPVSSVDSMKVVDIAAGYSHSVLLTRDGRVFVFGSDQFGQIGFGRKFDRRSTPQVVQELMGSHVSRIACGRCHTLVVISGKLWSFGLNSSGQLGNGLERNQISPRLADETLDHVAGIYAGWDQTFLVRQGGVFDVNSAPSAPMKYPKFLSGPRIHDLVAKHEKLDLMELLESVFSSLSCINGSFLFQDDRRFMTNIHCSGIDLDAVMDAFNLLSSTTDREQFAELVLTSCQMSLFCEEYVPSSYPSIECVRVFLILPWLDAFVVNVTAETVRNLHMPFAKLLDKLQENRNYWKTLEKWWAGLPGRHFKRLVSSMMAAVRVACLSRWSPQLIQPIMGVLDHLSIMNKMYNAVPLDCFYLPELNEHLDLVNDYAIWRTDPEKRPLCWSNHPYLLNGIAKVDILRVEAILTQHAVINRNAVHFLGMTFHRELPYFNIEVRREAIIDDTIQCILTAQQLDLMKPLKVKFVGEEGEDAGGVKKEFFMVLFQKMLSEEYGMFEEDPESHLLWFRGFPQDQVTDICFRLIGQLCAMAIYNNVLVNLPFPLALYKLLLSQKPTLDDLAELYPSTGKGLEAMLAYEEDDFEEVFGLNFTVDYKMLDKTVTEELKPHGAAIAVTKLNRQEYVQLFVQHKMEIGMDGRIGQEFDLFMAGFKQLISGETLGIFQPRELQEMVIGNENYDWTEFRKLVKYKGEYHAKHPSILTFWEAFFRLSLDERKKFMQFLMGSPRLPVKGLAGLNISIQPCADNLLPAAHTCANLLDLPKLTDPDELLRRLRISIQHVEGFTLV